MENELNTSNRSNYWRLEEKLESVLKPVSPDPVFVDALKFKLTHTPTVLLDSGRRQIGLVVILIGLITGSLVFWLTRKKGA